MDQFELQTKRELISHKWEIRMSASMRQFTPQTLYSEFVWYCQKCCALVEQNSEPSPTRKISIDLRDINGLVLPRPMRLTCAEYTVYRIMES